MEKRELLFVLGLAVLASFLSLLPTIWAYLKTPSGFWFAGFNVLFDPWDINTYFANIRQGLNGQWLYLNPYDTTSAARPLPIYSLYLLLGHLARIFHLPIPLIYHSASVFLTILFSSVLYFFLAFFFKEKNWRFLALFLILFGGGVGWLVFPKIILADIRFPDATVFQTLHLPHFILNQTLFLVTLLFSFWAFSFEKWRFSGLACLSGIFLAFVHPYSLLLVILIFFGYILILTLARKKLSGIVYFAPQFIIWLAGLTFFYLLLKGSLLINQQIPTPSSWFLFLSYGFLSPLAVWGAVSLWREKQEKGLFLLTWFIFQFLAIYSPLSFQRLLFRGFFIILCIMAVEGFKNLKISFVKKTQVVYFWFFASFTLTQIIMTLFLLLPSGIYDPWVYLTKEEKNVFDFLLKNTRKGENVLASSRLSNFLPANTNNHVYRGRNLGVGNVPEIEKNILAFYSGKLLATSPQFLKKEKIDYVFWGPEEKTLGNFDLTKEPYLENIYQNEKVTIFKVR